MKINIVPIGDELLNGQVTDTNSGYIARSLLPLGWEVNKVVTVHDGFDDIRSAIVNSMGECRVTVTTGGLGPTKDDITKSVLLDIFGGELVHNIEVEANIRKIVADRGIKLNSLTAAQAEVPSSCRVFQNNYGTAPVMWFEKDGRVLVSLPGVPFEMQGCWDNSILPELVSRFSSNKIIISRTYIVTGITESDLALRLDEFERSLPPMFHLAYLPNFNYIRLRLDAKSSEGLLTEDIFERQAKELKSLLGTNLMAEGDVEPPRILMNLLENSGMSLSIAESCTGGRISGAMTSLPGISQYFAGGVVAYSNAVKQSLLGVPQELLEAHGAVSREVVEAMAMGVAMSLHTDCAIATSGIAGPGGAVPGKPVGTVWCAVRVGDKVESKCFHFGGDRHRIVDRAVNAAILFLCDLIRRTIR